MSQRLWMLVWMMFLLSSTGGGGGCCGRGSSSPFAGGWEGGPPIREPVDPVHATLEKEQKKLTIIIEKAKKIENEIARLRRQGRARQVGFHSRVPQLQIQKTHSADLYRAKRRLTRLNRLKKETQLEILKLQQASGLKPASVRELYGSGREKIQQVLEVLFKLSGIGQGEVRLDFSPASEHSALRYHTWEERNQEHLKLEALSQQLKANSLLSYIVRRGEEYCQSPQRAFLGFQVLMNQNPRDFEGEVFNNQAVLWDLQSFFYHWGLHEDRELAAQAERQLDRECRRSQLKNNGFSHQARQDLELREQILPPEILEFFAKRSAEEIQAEEFSSDWALRRKLIALKDYPEWEKSPGFETVCACAQQILGSEVEVGPTLLDEVVDSIPVTVEGRNPEQKRTQGIVHYVKKEYSESLGIFRRQVTSEERTPEDHYYLAQSHRGLKHYPKAIEAFERLLMLKGSAGTPPKQLVRYLHEMIALYKEAGWWWEAGISAQFLADQGVDPGDHEERAAECFHEGVVGYSLSLEEKKFTPEQKTIQEAKCQFCKLQTFQWREKLGNPEELRACHRQCELSLEKLRNTARQKKLFDTFNNLIHLRPSDLLVENSQIRAWASLFGLLDFTKHLSVPNWHAYFRNHVRLCF